MIQSKLHATSGCAENSATAHRAFAQEIMASADHYRAKKLL
jgi:hypothetical protein